jgi:hypothetical protein
VTTGEPRVALAALLDRVRRAPDVRVVRLSIAPGNVASQRVALPFGFREVGEQVDPRTSSRSSSGSTCDESTRPGRSELPGGSSGRSRGDTVVAVGKESVTSATGRRPVPVCRDEPAPADTRHRAGCHVAPSGSL